MDEEATLVERASEAATDLIFSRYQASEIEDLDVTVSFEDEQLEVDVYFETGASSAAERERERQTADDAAMAAADAVEAVLERSD